MEILFVMAKVRVSFSKVPSPNFGLGLNTHAEKLDNHLLGLCFALSFTYHLKFAIKVNIRHKSDD
jgi:hypothetical protein